MFKCFYGIKGLYCQCLANKLPDRLMARLASTSLHESRRVGQQFKFMKYFVYILKSLVANKSYVGMTNDLTRRLDEHNSGKHFYTKRYCPWVMIYSEEYDSLKGARAREKYLKSASGRKFLKELFSK